MNYHLDQGSLVGLHIHSQQLRCLFPKVLCISEKAHKEEKKKKKDKPEIEELLPSSNSRILIPMGNVSHPVPDYGTAE